MGMGLVLAILLLLVFPVSAEHLPWMAPYKDAIGTSCCNDQDCVETGARILAMTPTTTTVNVVWIVWDHTQVFVNETFDLPAKSVHRSEVAAGYWCFRRGVYQPGGRYCLGGPGEAPSVNIQCTRCLFLATGS